MAMVNEKTTMYVPGIPGIALCCPAVGWLDCLGCGKMRKHCHLVPWGDSNVQSQFVVPVVREYFKSSAVGPLLLPPPLLLTPLLLPPLLLLLLVLLLLLCVVYRRQETFRPQLQQQ